MADQMEDKPREGDSHGEAEQGKPHLSGVQGAEARDHENEAGKIVDGKAKVKRETAEVPKLRMTQDRKAVREKVSRANLAEWIMAFAAIAMFVTSYLQWNITSGQLAVIRAEQRPYVGVAETTVTENANGALILAVLKNFGHTPAFEFSYDYEFFINGIELKPRRQSEPNGTFTFYPGADQGLQASIPETKWIDVASGRSRLTFRSSVQYRWPAAGQGYKGCEEREYSPITKNFRIVGNCSGSLPSN